MRMTDLTPQFGKIYKIDGIANDVFFVAYQISPIAVDHHYHGWNVEVNNHATWIKKITFTSNCTLFINEKRVKLSCYETLNLKYLFDYRKGYVSANFCPIF